MARGIAERPGDRSTLGTGENTLYRGAAVARFQVGLWAVRDLSGANAVGVPNRIAAIGGSTLFSDQLYLAPRPSGGPRSGRKGISDGWPRNYVLPFRY